MSTEARALHLGTSFGNSQVVHATAEQHFDQPVAEVFAAFVSWQGYELWAPSVQGAAHWLDIHRGGVGSRFLLYDKPGAWHLLNDGEVTVFEAPHRFGWRAPFSEWPRATIGTDVEFTSSAEGGTRVRESLVFEVDEPWLPSLTGFLCTPDLDEGTFERFLRRRLAGLSQALADGLLEGEEMMEFTEDRLVAADWAGRISTGEWTRILYADGELDFDAPPEVAFDAFARFARYRDWTRDIHVGCEWLDVRAGGVGSTFYLWEKPGDRQVMHRAVVTEFERGHRFTWRAPFAEWGKVFIGTALTLEPGPGGSSHGYHVLYADVPTDLLAVFGGFGSLHGFDMEFETFHIHEEARGFNRLLQQRAFTEQETSDLFARDQPIATAWPLQDGRRWPPETLALEPDRTITFEQLMIELSETMAGSIPSPSFVRRHRDLARTRTYNPQATP